jgi:hypothetical protein
VVGDGGIAPRLEATALIYADPDLLRQLTGPLNEDLGPVPVPVDDGPDER